MQNNREEWINERAYELWEQSGRTYGQDHEHWRQASGEWDARSADSSFPANSQPSCDDEES